jgi:hypothetical protein
MRKRTRLFAWKNVGRTASSVRASGRATARRSSANVSTRRPLAERQRERWLRPDAERYLRPDWERYVRPDSEAYLLLRTYDRKYSPEQPRDDQGRWTDGALPELIAAARQGNRDADTCLKLLMRDKYRK